MEDSSCPPRQNILAPISENVIQHFSCDLCDANFSSVINFKTHMEVHIKTHEKVLGPVINPAPTKVMIQSPETIERSLDKGNINSEMNLKTTLATEKRPAILHKGFKCPNCPKNFSTKGNRKQHFSTCTNKARNITENMDVSGNDDPLMCKSCLKYFSTKGNLYTHKSIHLHDKPFKCAQCPATFSQKGNFKYHEKKGSCRNKVQKT